MAQHGPYGQRQERARGTRVFEKPARTTDELVDQLDQRGLVILDRDRAKRYLRQLGYFRLSPYTIPFQELPRTNEHLFKPEVEFDHVLDLYVFDRQLRLLVMDALGRIEVAVRAAITDHMAITYEDPHWYTSAEHFYSADRHRKFIEIIEDEVQNQRSRDAEQDGSEENAGIVFRSALEHYVVTYGEPELPPSWLMVELLTIGQLNGLYINLKRRKDMDTIAKILGLNEAILRSWLKTYVRVRNVCAHHGRLWNVGLGVYPKIPTSRDISWLQGDGALPRSSEKRLYPVLASLQAVLNVVSPRSSWASRLHELLSSRPAMNLRGMGIPEDWAADPFWAAHIESA